MCAIPLPPTILPFSLQLLAAGVQTGSLLVMVILAFACDQDQGWFVPVMTVLNTVRGTKNRQREREKTCVCVCVCILYTLLTLVLSHVARPLRLRMASLQRAS